LAGGKGVSVRIKMETGEHEVKELKQSVKRLQTLMDEAPIIICNTDLKGKITYVNKRCEKATGYSREEVLGKNGFKLGIFSDETVKLLAKRMKDRLMGRPPRLQEMQLKCKDGHWIWIAMEGRLMRVEGIPVGFQIMARDITERKQAEEALQAEKNKLQSVIDAMENGLTIQDRDYNIIYQNEVLRRFGDHVGEKCYRVYEGKDKLCDGCPVEKAFRDGKSHTSERKLVTPSGKVIFRENTANPVRDAGGRIVSCLEIVRSITERKQAEEALRQSREELRKMFESVTDGIVVVDLNGVITEVNRRAVEIHGFGSKDELLGKGAFELVAPGDHEKIANNMRKAIKQGIIRGVEYTLLRADGSEFPAELSTSVLKDASGNPVAQITIVRDITERKQAEETLKESESKFKNLFEYTKDAIFLADAQTGILVDANPAACRMLGLPKEKVVGMHQSKIHPLEMVEQYKQLFRNHVEKGAAVTEDLIVQCADGSRVPVDISASVFELGGKRIIQGVFRDTTERKQAEEALRQSREQLRKMFESVTDGILVVDLNSVIIETNKRTMEIHGFSSKDELLGRNAFELVAPRDHERVATNIAKAIKRGIIRSVECTLLRADGSEFPGELSTNVLKDASGNPVAQITIVRDISERKQAEETLLESEERFRSIVENSHAGIMILDDAYRFIYVNPQLCRISGYPPNELIGQDFRKFLDEESKQLVADRYIRRQRGEEIPPRYEFNIVPKDGQKRRVEISSAVIKDSAGGVKTVAQILDITERKQAEEKEKQLQQELYLSRRLAAIGELAAGVAHEINNPLTGVLGFSQRLLRKSTSEEVSRGLEIIHSEAQRAAGVVQNLLTFARRRQPKKEYSNINDIVQKALELRAYALQTSNIEVVTNLAPGLPEIMVDFPQVQEVFLNIILNAEQAMSETYGRGKLIIKAREVKDYVRISFADDGPGIPPEQLDKVFDPFFTTREEKGGTGLGLSACHGIVTEHGGRIYARSKPGKGATFFVELPLSLIEATLVRRF
jgi:two-component system NtrC family sensor kinase